MAVSYKRTIWWVSALVLAFLVGLAVLQGCKREPTQPAPSAPKAGATGTEQPAAQSGTSAKGPVEAAKDLLGGSSSSLQKIVAEAQTWQAAFPEWQGKIAPDFTLTDIQGNVQTLSSYRGKNVLVVIWATWCPPCKKEAPELVELRKSIPPDKLAILAISSREGVDLVKSFASQYQVNYTVMAGAGASLPSPYVDVQNIPSAFFIDPEGKIKLSTMGMLPREDINKILEAK
jgi:peroxiredoxin